MHDNASERPTHMLACSFESCGPLFADVMPLDCIAVHIYPKMSDTWANYGTGAQRMHCMQ